MPPTPPIIQFGNCPGYETACTTWGNPPVVTFKDTAEYRRSYWHEMGHVYDAEVMEPKGLRPKFAAIFGWKWTTPRAEEWFAQTYALCARNLRLTKTFTTGYFGFRITPKQHRQACHLIRSSSW